MARQKGNKVKEEKVEQHVHEDDPNQFGWHESPGNNDYKFQFPMENPILSGITLVKMQNDQQVVIARQYRRDLDLCRKKILFECDPSWFYSMDYKTKHGIKKIEGGSIKLAHCIYRNWGNCRVTSMPIQDDEDKLVIQASFMDYENNSCIQRTVRTEKVLMQGDKLIKSSENPTRDRQLYNTMCSFAERAVIFASIPGRLYNECVEAAKNLVIGEIKNNKDLKTRFAQLLEKYSEHGISMDIINEYLKRPKSNKIVTKQEYLDLLGKYNAISEGAMNVADIFKSAKQNQYKTPGEGLNVDEIMPDGDTKDPNQYSAI